MKQLILLSLLATLLFSCGQSESGDEKKVSPAQSASLTLANTRIAIKYSSPQKRNRELWGNLVPYNEIWRTGADEATTLETSQALLIGNDTLPKGKYALFTIPNPEEWTVIFNKEWDQWGAFNYDSSKDALRTQVKPYPLSTDTEGLTISLLEENDRTGELKMVWGKLQIALGFQVVSSTNKTQ